MGFLDQDEMKAREWLAAESDGDLEALWLLLNNADPEMIREFVGVSDGNTLQVISNLACQCLARTIVKFIGPEEEP